MRNAPREIAKRLFRSLPPNMQDGLRTVRAGARQMFVPSVSAKASGLDISSFGLPEILTPSRFAKWTETYSGLSDERAKQDATLAEIGRAHV